MSAQRTTKFYGAGMLAVDEWTDGRSTPGLLKLSEDRNELTAGSGPDDNLMKVDFDAVDKYIIVKGCRPKEYVTRLASSKGSSSCR